MLFYDASEVDGDGVDEGHAASAEEKGQNTEVVLFLVDFRSEMRTQVLSSGQTCMEYAFASLERFLKSKIVAQPNDRVAIVLYGPVETKNDYDLEHVHVLQKPDPLHASFIREIQTFHEKTLKTASEEEGKGEEKTDSSNGLALKNALWTCSLMFKDFKTKRVDKRLFIFTNDDAPCGDNAVVEQQIISRLDSLKELNVDFQIYPLGEPGGAFRPDFWANVIKGVKSEEDFLTQAQLKLSDKFEMIRSKINAKRRWMATSIQVAEGFEIHVEYYLLASRQKNNPKYLDAETNALLKSDTAYISEAGEVLEEPPLKGWDIRGKQIVSTPLEYEELKDLGLDGFHLLGFKPTSYLKSYHQARSAAFLYPNEREHPGSYRLFIAFHEKMWQLDQMAICSFSSTRGNASAVHMVALIAQKEGMDESGNQVEPPGMWAIFLPYADDLRYPEHVPRSKKEAVEFASKEQVETAKQVVRALQLDDFEPTYTQNPTLQRHYEILQCIALDEDPTKCKIVDETMPDPDLFKQAEEAIDSFRDQFPTVVNDRKRPFHTI